MTLDSLFAASPCRPHDSPCARNGESMGRSCIHDLPLFAGAIHVVNNVSMIHHMIHTVLATRDQRVNQWALINPLLQLAIQGANQYGNQLEINMRIMAGGESKSESLVNQRPLDLR